MKNFKIIIVLLIISTIISCQPNDQPANNGLAVEQSSVNADFTISIVAGSDNKFVLKAASTNVLSNQWNLNDGNQPFVGTSTQEIFLPFAGTYEIEHTTVSKGGAYNKTTQNVTVNSSDPLFGNLVQGGNFATADDLSKWEILRIAGTHVNWTFADGFATVKGSHPSNYGQQGIFQAIDVVANKKYCLMA